VFCGKIIWFTKRVKLHTILYLFRKTCRQKGDGNMTVVLEFPEKIATLKEDRKIRKPFSLFGRISDRLGVDLDKVFLEDDEQESQKLERALHKETIKHRMRLIEE
jgi:hypothetical protein